MGRSGPLTTKSTWSRLIESKQTVFGLQLIRNTAMTSETKAKLWHQWNRSMKPMQCWSNRGISGQGEARQLIILGLKCINSPQVSLGSPKRRKTEPRCDLTPGRQDQEKNWTTNNLSLAWEKLSSVMIEKMWQQLLLQILDNYNFSHRQTAKHRLWY